MKDEMTPDQPQGPEVLRSKRPSRDYSELPQRPITLKNDIGGLVLPKAKEAAEVASKPKARLRPKPLARKTSKPAVKWSLEGISEVVLEAAANAAKEDGMPLERWVEQAILHALVETEPPEPVEPPEPPEPIVIETPDMKLLNLRLEEISQHLQRIEKQRGFWMQLWERLIAEGRS